MAHRRTAALVQIGVTVAAALLVTVGLAITRGGIGCEQVVVASSQEKFAFMQRLAKAFNDDGLRVPPWPGRCEKVNVVLVKSGDAVGYLVTSWGTAPAGYARPDVWSPASSAWLRSYSALSSAGPVAEDMGSLFQSPSVIGMPKPMAQALGWPAPISWKTLLALATDPAGWSRVAGAGEWGPFRFGKTNPHISTSGLHALMATFSAAGADISPSTVRSPAALAFAQSIERSVLHYAPTATDFLRILCDIDARASAPLYPQVFAYMSAIAIEEKELVDYNDGKIAGAPPSCGKPNVPLVALYPTPGTLYADHPYALLSWSQAKAAAADDFFQFVRQQEALMDAEGFRDKDGRAGRQLAQPQHLIAAGRPTQLPGPIGAVIEAELTAWNGIRKPAHVLLLVHGSIPPDTKGYLSAAVDRFGPQDSIGLASFAALPSGGDGTTVEVGIAPVSLAHVGQVQTAIDKLSGTGGNLQTALGVALAEVQRSYDPTAVNAVVVVDLEPPSGVSATLAAQLQRQAPNQFVRVFTVGPAIGKSRALKDIATDGEGLYYPPNPGPDFLKDLISNF